MSCADEIYQKEDSSSENQKTEHYSASNQRFKPNDLNSLNSWMASIKDETKLARISIPGTHDSGTFELRDPVKQVWGMTQELNFQEQMNNGIRFFDIRVRATSNTNLFLHHGIIYLYVSLWKFISDAQSFLNENSSETIIMSIKQDHDAIPGVTKDVTSIFKDTYYPESIFYKGITENPTLGETRGKIVVLSRISNSYEIAGFNANGWQDNKTFSRKINSNLTINVQDQYKVNYYPKKDAIRNFLVETNNNLSDNSLFINFTSLSSGGTAFNSPYYYASYFNPETAQFIENNIKNRAGWVIMDYVGNRWSPLLQQKVIETNKNLIKN